MQIHGQAAIITGGGSGMGAATARAFAAAGAKVALFDIQAEKVEAVAKETGGAAFLCDVTDGDSVAKAITAARAAHGPARIVVNCAGVATAGKILGKEGPLPLADFKRVIDINLVGSFNVMRLAVEGMQNLEPLAEGERGVIIHTASVAAFEGQVGQAAYAASKGGIVGLTLPAAREFSRYGIRVMAIAPGLIDTPMFAGLNPTVVEKLKENTVFPKRLGQAREYADLACHIVGNLLLNGSTIRLDGAVRLS